MGIRSILMALALLSAATGPAFAVAPVAFAFTASAVPYNDGSSGPSSIDLVPNVLNAPTIFTLGSSVTTAGGTISVTNLGIVSYTPPVGFRGNDTFNYAAKNVDGSSSSKTVTVPVSNPIVTFSPASGALADATAGVAYAGAAVTATGGRGAMAYSASAGLNGSGLSIDPVTGAIAGTSPQLGDYSFTISAIDHSTPAFTATSGTYTLKVVAPPAPLVLSPADNSLFAAHVGDAISQQFSAVGGGGSYSFSVSPSGDPLPAGLTFDAAGLLSGAATVAGTAEVEISVIDSNTTTTTQIYHFRIFDFTFSPAAGSLPNGTTSTSYAGTFAASGGAGSYSYAITAGSLPTGLSLDAGGALSGTPTAAATSSFTVTATDSNGDSEAASYSLVIDPAVIIAPANGATLPAGTVNLAYVATTITASGGVGAITFAATGLPVGLAIDPNTGVISGTPTAATNASVTVTATAATSGSASATYSLAISAAPVPPVVMSPVSGATLPSGTVNVAYAGTTITASGGAGAISFGATGLPPGLSIDANTGAISGTPTTAANAGVTVTATAATSGVASATYTLVIGAAPGAGTFTPAAGALPDGMAEEHYSEKFSIPGGSNYQSYGTLPPGFNPVGDGAWAGTLAAGSAGTYNFTITADVGGAPVSAQYSLTVNAREVTVQDRQVIIPPGATPPPVDLTAGATGGPFTQAIIVAVTPQEAGTAEVIMGDVASIDTVWLDKFYLKFHPNPAFGGKALVTYTLVSATGSSSATVTFTASLDPDGVANNFDHLVKDFVHTRADLLASSIDTPGLRQRRSIGSGARPGIINVSPSGNSITMNFASSLLELRSWGEAGDAAGALAQGDAVEAQPVNFWIDGTATLHLRSDDGDDHWGKFALLSAGADYLVNDKLLVGLAVHADVMDDLAETTTVEGTGILIGPYVSAEIGDGVFLDASLYYGRSWNDITTSIFRGAFETERVLAKASLEGQWALSEALVLRPRAGGFYLHEATGQYTVRNGLGSSVTVDGFATDQLRLSAGGTLEYTMALGEGLTIIPYLGAEFGLSLTTGRPAGGFTTLSTGFDLLGLGNLTLGGAVEASLQSDSLKALSAKASLRAAF